MGTFDRQILEGLLNWLHPTRSIANREYCAVYGMLTLYFEGHDCDPGVCVFETICRLSRIVSPGRVCANNNGGIIENKRAFILRIARNVRYEHLRVKNRACVLPPDRVFPDSIIEQPVHEESEEREAELLLQTGRKLSVQMLGQRHPDEWTLVREYTMAKASGGGCDDLARKYKMNINSLRVRTCRCKARLRVRYLHYLKELLSNMDN